MDTISPSEGEAAGSIPAKGTKRFCAIGASALGGNSS